MKALHVRIHLHIISNIKKKGLHVVTFLLLFYNND